MLSPSAITLRWVSRLRWGAAGGQALTVVATSTLLHLPVPTGWLALVIGATVVTNGALVAWLRRPREAPVSPRLLAAVLAFDTLSLYALLYLTGGPSNPFSVLFLVQIALAALVLGLGYALAMTVLSTAAYAALFAANVPLAGMEHMHHAGTSAFSVHLQGMFVAFLLAAVLIAYFVTRVARELRTRERALAIAERRAQTNEKLASLSTLAAGAAHELGTPLATIAVVATELERAAARLPDSASSQSLRDDARLVRTQVERCSAIVRQMGQDAGGPVGEAPEPLAGHEVKERLLRGVDPEQAVRLDVEAFDIELRLPPRALVQVLGSLVKNAFDASKADGRVRVSLETRLQDGSRRARFVVGDRGLGMTSDELARIGEPFFTTKPPGAGLGLGVFLARAFADRLGGHLSFTSRPGEGTTVVLDLPTAFE